MKKLILLLAVFLIACSSGEKHAAIPKGATVLILGDSLSYGTGANEGEDYPSLLAKTTGWAIINAGIPGNTSAEGLERLPALLEQDKPKLLIVELGGNDLLRHMPQSETISNLKAILALSKAKGVKSILVAIPEVSALRAAVGNLADHPLYEDIANETATPLIADVFSEVLSDTALKSDQIHPNAQGYGEVSKKMNESLKQLGFTS
ncbi:MAG: GDSL-type esterase/lipase family protein [Methylotenera sp.]|nr:arylesterase [Methylotenera sp.]